MAKIFQVGDIVQLKSESPKMTVIGYEKKTFEWLNHGGENLDKVETTWFTDDGKCNSASFPSEALITQTPSFFNSNPPKKFLVLVSGNNLKKVE